MGIQGQQHFVGVDVGTSSARACVIDHTGELLAAASCNTQTWSSSPGSYEQSTQDIWQSICTAVKEAVAEARVDADTVCGITVSATCSLAVFRHATTEPVSMSFPAYSGDDHNVMLWMHSNATKEADRINSLKHESVRHLGNSISPLMALPKVLWLKHTMPEDLFKTCQFYDLHNALLHIAVGGKAFSCSDNCDPSIWSRGYGVDGTIRGWSPDLLNDVGLEELVQAKSKTIGGLCENGHALALGAPAGTLCEQAARQLGLSTDVVVGCGAIDCYAGWAGTVGAKFDVPQNTDFDFRPTERLAIVAGTSACHILASDRADFVPGIWGPYKDFLMPGTNVMAGGQSAVGHLVQHTFDMHPATASVKAAADSQGLSIFDYMNRHLIHMQKTTGAPNITFLARHLFFYGDHFGNRSPITDPRMKGAIVGLSGDKGIDDLAIMYYATLEFLALQSRHIISTIRDGKHKVGAIFMSGSLCKNEMFVDLLATACDMPIITPAYVHAAVVYGSALLSAVATRKASKAPDQTLWSTMEDMSRPGKLFLPSTDLYMKDLLDVKYVVFLELAERQRIFRDMIDTLSTKHNV